MALSATPASGGSLASGTRLTSDSPSGSSRGGGRQGRGTAPSITSGGAAAPASSATRRGRGRAPTLTGCPPFLAASARARGAPVASRARRPAAAPGVRLSASVSAPPFRHGRCHPAKLRAAVSAGRLGPVRRPTQRRGSRGGATAASTVGRGYTLGTYTLGAPGSPLSRLVARASTTTSVSSVASSYGPAFPVASG